MPKLAAPLTLQRISELLPKAKRYTRSDGKNLYLVIEPDGKKIWHFSYKRLGKPTTISFGSFPEISLSDARLQREESIKLIAQGIDPVNQSREQNKLSRSARAKAPILNLSMSEIGGMVIENKYSRITLNVAQVAALKSFLIATNEPSEG